MAATSDEAKVSDALRDMIARSAEWKIWTADTEANAKLHVDITEIDSDDIADLPRARIGQGEAAEIESQVFASGQGGMLRGRRSITFFDTYSGAGTWKSEEETFNNRSGQVIQELLSDAEGLVNLRVTETGATMRPDDTDSDANQLIKKRYILAFGLEGLSD